MARSAYSSHPGASTTTLSREPSEDSFEPHGVGLIERGPTLRIDVEHRHQRACSVEDRHHDLRLGPRVARDVSGESLDVRHDYGPPLGCGGAADSAAEGDLEAAKSSLIWADAQEVRRDNAVESRPEVPKGVLDEGCQGRHGRNVVIDARQDADQLRVQQSVRPLARLIAKVQHRFTHWSPFRPASNSTRAHPNKGQGFRVSALIAAVCSGRTLRPTRSMLRGGGGVESQSTTPTGLPPPARTDSSASRRSVSRVWPTRAQTMASGQGSEPAKPPAACSNVATTTMAS